MGQSHGIDSSTAVTTETADYVARVMGALAAPSRVRILARLRSGSCSVGELTAAVGMEQPAVSHQLRVLRDLNLVRRAREGRYTVYELADHHVAMLLDEALRHVEHLRTGEAATVALASAPATTTLEQGAA
jgi:ArsR family transcriptional regulator, nickel/cobalt-responsive transcriptional repressor